MSIYLSGIDGSYDNSVWNILRKCQTFPVWLSHFSFSADVYEGSTFFTFSVTQDFLILTILRLSRSGFDLYFADS